MGGFTITPNAVGFAIVQGSSTPQSKNVQVTGDTVPIVATVDQAWLAVAPASGNPPLTLTLTELATALPAGIYTSVLTVESK